MRKQILSKILIFLSAFILCMLTEITLMAQEYYWIGFIDKKNSPYSISNPGQYLSQKSIQRRLKQNIPVDEKDLPVNPAYVNAVKNLGVQIVHSSKWLNGVTVSSTLKNFPDSLKKLTFIKEYQLTKPGVTSKSLHNKFEAEGNPVPIDTTKYGPSVYQTGIMNGQFLHNKGFLGQGMVIAVLDAGFYKANQFSAFNRLRSENRILGTRDFVNPAADIYAQNSHGMSVLSTMGGYIPGSLIGTAPDASYWLIRPEDTGSEYLIEEDNWVAAAEFADSLGVDVINSSLGYCLFDAAAMNHTYRDMDGKTTRVTRGANIAASRGILVFASAGNEHSNPWHFIIAPSDGDSVISVAAVNKSGQVASFSSSGPGSDGDIKPNVAAVGWNTVLQGSAGNVVYANGTSFSSPVLAGMGACLWQANPDARAREVKAAIEQSGHLYSKPDSVLGYGIPDFQVADFILKTLKLNRLESSLAWQVFPNPFTEKLLLHFFHKQDDKNLVITIYSLNGNVIYRETAGMKQNIVFENLGFLPAGMYILAVRANSVSGAMKIIKSK